jgi:hypothetical protein
MPLELITIKDLNDFKADLIKELKQLFSKNDVNDSKRFLKSREVRKILRISAGTLQSLRRNRSLHCRKLGGILYYDYEDIQRLMRKL